MPSRYYGISQGAAAWLEIRGTPTAPTLFRNIDFFTRFASSGIFYAMAAHDPDSGEVLAGGLERFGNPNGPGMWRSIDGAASWTEITLTLLPHTDRDSVLMSHIVGPGVIWFYFRSPSSSGIWSWDGISFTLEKQFFAGSLATGGLHGGLASDIYGSSRGLGQNKVWHYDGIIWASSLFPITAPETFEPVPIDVHVIGTKSYWFTHRTATAWLFSGSGTGPWTVEFTFPAGVAPPANAGARLMDSDELGALWMAVPSSGATDVYRRDPASGITSLFKALSGIGVLFGFALISSTDMIVFGTSAFYWYDGTTWNLHTYAGLGWTGISDISHMVGEALQSIASIDLPAVDTSGGIKVVVTGTFTIDASMAVHFGPNGDTTDPRCYGGSGIGTDIFSANGTTFVFITPPTPKGTNTLTVVVDGDTLTLPVTVVERNRPGKLHTQRSSYPPWQGVGKLRLELEDLD